jgi:Cdc6-like AAA superfamily ATPase
MQHVDDLLWDFHSISQKLPRVGLILVSTNQAKLRSLIGQRLYDRLNPETYEFSAYSADRLLEVINARIKQAFPKNFVDKDSLSRLCDYVAEQGGNVRHLFSLLLDAVDLMPRGSPKLSSELEDIINREKSKQLSAVIDEMHVSVPKKYELLKIIQSSKDVLDTGAIIALANTNGLHISGRTVQNYLVDLERMKLVKLERIRKGQGHSQAVRMLVTLDGLQ